MSVRAARLTDVFAALESMVERLDWSLRDDARLFPVDPVTLGDRDTAKGLDAFLKRFEQTSDHVLRKLFPAIVVAAGVEALTRPLIDVLDRLHRFGVIDDPQTWVRIVDLRNRLVHDYALDRARLAEELTAAWKIAPVVIAQIAAARLFAKRKHLLGPKETP